MVRPVVFITAFLCSVFFFTAAFAEDETVRESPKFINALKQGEKHLEAGDVKGAISAFKKATETSPENPIGWKYLGEANRLAGYKNAALAAYKKSVELDPAQPDIHFLIGSILFGSGKAKEALESFDACLRHEPGGYKGHYGRSLALAKLGRIADALEAVEKAAAVLEKEIKDKPDRQKENASLLGAFYQNIGTLALKAGDSEKAQAAFEKLAAVSPEDHETLATLGKIYIAAGKSARAIEVLTKAITLNGNSGDYFYDLGNAYAQANELEKAILNYRRASELSPKDHLPHYGMGEALAALREFDNALDEYKKAIDLKPDDPSASRGYGEVRYLLGDLNEALAVLEYAETLDNSDAQILTLLGDVHGDLGNYDNALEYFTRAKTAGGKADSVDGKIAAARVFAEKRKKTGATADAAKKHMNPSDPLILESKHYWMRSTAAPEFADIALSTAEEIHAAFLKQFKIEPDMKEKCGLVFFNSRSEYREHCKKSSPALAGNDGFFDSEKREIVLYKRRGIETAPTREALAHEILHYLLHDGFKTAMRGWIVEALATYWQTLPPNAPPGAVPAIKISVLKTIEQAAANMKTEDMAKLFSAADEVFQGASKESVYAVAYSIAGFLYAAKGDAFNAYLEDLRTKDRSAEKHWDAFISKEFETNEKFLLKWKEFIKKQTGGAEPLKK
jgi:tetratricopeptide (TPR) repeat protein